MKLSEGEILLSSKKYGTSHKVIGKKYNKDDVYRFENKTISRNLYKMELSRYEELLPFVYYLKGYVDHKYYEDYALLSFTYRYDKINKRLKYAEEVGELRTDIGNIKVDQSDINLLTALATDSEFAYLNFYNFCHENNLDERDNFNKKFGFYSKKLIVIEQYIFILFKSYEKDFKLPEFDIRGNYGK